MGDFQSLGLFDPPLTVITTKEIYDESAGMTSSLMNNATAWPSANRAIFCPFYVKQVITIYQMAIEVTTQSGNLDIGIYKTDGTRLVSKGSTAVAAAGVQAVDITDTTLTPGIYFAALNIDNTTAAVRAAAGSTVIAVMSGVRQQAVGAVTLPASATLAVASSSTWPYIALFTTGQTI